MMILKIRKMMGNAVTNYFELSISVESGWNEFHIHYSINK